MAEHAVRLHAPADFGRALRQARLARGLSQEQLADALALPQSTVSEIENGKSTIYLRRLLTLARATGLQLTATWQEGDDASGR